MRIPEGGGHVFGSTPPEPKIDKSQALSRLAALDQKMRDWVDNYDPSIHIRDRHQLLDECRTEIEAIKNLLQPTVQWQIDKGTDREYFFESENKLLNTMQRMLEAGTIYSTDNAITGPNDLMSEYNFWVKQVQDEIKFW